MAVCVHPDGHRYRANLLLYWRDDCDEPLAVMTDLAEAEAASDTYRERPFIETLHRDIKSGGDEVEGSRVTDNGSQVCHASRIF